ncbi:MAG: AAA family ATPase [Candidatus Competibacteraceae bacterium]|nr:AAA family ATPase [Candidatus Competibacteraceae bacterium]
MSNAAHCGATAPKNHAFQNGIDPELAAACGIDPPTTAKPRTTFATLGELLKTPPAENWIVKSLIPANSIIVLFGNSGDGKTFVTIDLLCHIAAGLPWLGHKTRQGPVMYLAGEGQHGIIRRFKAWFEAHPGHDDAAANILIRTIPAALCDPVATADLLAEIAAMPVKPQAIAIDTLARNFGPGDENSTKDMSAFVAALDALRTVSGGAAILLPHHSGHGDKGRARGSSVLKGAIDTEFCIERKDTRITMSCSKMKDADEPPPLAWLLTRQDLPWADEDGVPMNSAVLVPTQEEQSGTFEKKARLPAAQRIAVDALKSTLIRDGVDADGVVTVAEDQWRQAAYSAGISSSDKVDSSKKPLTERAKIW